MMRPQQRPQQQEQTQGAQPKGLMQQFAERQAQRGFPGQQPPMLPQLHQNGRMQSMGNGFAYHQYAQPLNMYDGSCNPRGQAPVQMQYPPAGMSGMPHPDGMLEMSHPDGMYCGPLGYGQTQGQVRPSEQQSVEAVVQQPGQPWHRLCSQLVACQQTRQADMSLSEASPTGITEVRTEIDIVSAKNEDEAHQFRAALRYASHPILSDAKMRSRATQRAEYEQQCGSDNESLSSCVGRTPVKGERAPSPSSDCTASTRELAPSVQLSAATQFGPLGRAATGRCGICA